MSQSPAVDVRNVSKVIGGRDIIKNISFSIQPGEIYGFLGPNGAGKTTTIRMMVGLISMTSGDIFINGHSIRTARTRALQRIGAIVENPELYRYMTGRKNLKHYAQMYDKPVPNDRIEKIIRLVELEDAIDRKVKTYSLGMRQRLGIAQALLHKPSILILDEPTNGLDPSGIRKLRDYLRSLALHENMSILISSHLISEIELICDRVIIIQDGRLVDERTLRRKEEEQTNLVVEFEVTDVLKAAESLGDKGTVQVGERTVAIETSKDQIPEIVRRLTQLQVGIYRINTKETALEDVFLDVTGGSREHDIYTAGR